MNRIEPTSLPAAPRWPGLVVAGLGASGMLGWVLGLPQLVTLLPGGSPMVFNTALGLLVTGLSLVALLRGFGRTARTGAAIVLVLGALTLAQFPLGIDLGVDQLFWTQRLDVPVSAPGRMAPNSAAGFILCGIALLLSVGSRRHPRVVAVLASLVLATAVLGITATRSACAAH